MLEKIRMAAQAGVDWVQIREKNLNGRESFELARAAVDAVSEGKALIFLNDRLDVAVAAGAAGAHLGRESLPARGAVLWCRGGNAPAGFKVGISCHSVDEISKAEDAGAAYVFFGPVFDTPAKRKFGAPQGIAKLAEVCAATRIPVVAIGGVDSSNGAECIRAGASGVAAIRMFQEATDVAALQETITRLHGANGKL